MEHYWVQVEKNLKDSGISEIDIELIRQFLKFFPFTKRQQLMGIFLGFPGKAGFFY